jgi:hypothetical protein
MGNRMDLAVGLFIASTDEILVEKDEADKFGLIFLESSMYGNYCHQFLHYL